MTRTISTVEKNVICLPTVPVVVSSNTATTVLNDVSSDPNEYAGRYIQNLGPNPLYYSIGYDCNGVTNCHGYLAQYAQLAIGAAAQSVSVYCTGGCTVSTTVYKRNDLQRGNGGILGSGSI
jgi:hypothetical protein